MSEQLPVNFRDIGGISVNNHHLVPGIFYRSGQLLNLSSETVHFLTNQCGIRKVYDFRSKNEVTRMPDTTLPLVTIENLDILQSASQNLANMNNITDGNIDVRLGMLKTYEELVMTPSAQENYRLFFEDIIANKQPILFHCFAGKDRTGFAAAIILKIAGATEQQIMTDYLKTNKLRHAANEAILKRVSHDKRDALAVALNVDSDYLTHAKETIIKNYGSFNHYLQEGIGLPNDYVTEFRQLYVN